MFKKEKKIDPTVVDTVIGETVVIEGTIKTKTSIQIDGKLTGELHSDGNVTVGATGELNANVKARELVVEGTINGNVTAEEKLVIKSSGKVVGETKTNAFVVDEGGVFLGKSNMLNKENAEAKKEVASTKQNAEAENSKDSTSK